MSHTQYFDTPQGRRIAYHKQGGQGPCIVFCGGLKSDMEGTKAVHLEAWAKDNGYASLRFDYSGHGESSGRFEEGCIGDWHQDTLAILKGVTAGPLLIVGSSMGGWQALLLARAIPERIAGMVTIAASPDFTEDSYLPSFSDAQKEALERDGFVELPSDYMDPYIVTKRMIEDGRNHLVMRDRLVMDFPVRFLQGTADEAVSTAHAVGLLEHAEGPDMRLTLVKDADHRFSDATCLKLLEEALADVIARI